MLSIDQGIPALIRELDILTPWHTHAIQSIFEIPTLGVCNVPLWYGKISRCGHKDDNEVIKIFVEDVLYQMHEL